MSGSVMEEGQKHASPYLTYPYLAPELNEDSDICCEEMDLHRSCETLGCKATPEFGHNEPRSYDLNQLNISFAGCGFLGIYHMGVAAAFRHFVPESKFEHLCGASAGALAATGLVAGIPITNMVTTLLEVAGEARRHFGGALNPAYNITDVLYTKLRQILPEDIHERANGKLFVSVTKIMDGKNVVIENYASREELIQAIVSSAFIPGFSGSVPPVFRGCRVIDGGFSCNMPDIFEHTITVSPFAGSAIICPVDDAKVREHDISRLHFSDQGTDLTLANAVRLRHVMFPPTLEDLNRILMSGFQDGHRFLRTQGFVSCGQCLTIRSEMKECEDSVHCDAAEPSLPQAFANAIDAFKNRAEAVFLRSSAKFSFVNSAWNFVYQCSYYTPPMFALRTGVHLCGHVAKGTKFALVHGSHFAFLVLEILTNSKIDNKFDRLLASFAKRLGSTWFTITTPRVQHPIYRRSQQRSVSMDINIQKFGRDEEDEDEDNFSGDSSLDDFDGMDLLQIHVEHLLNDSCSNEDPTNEEEARAMQADNLLNASRSGENISRSVSRLGSRIASKRNSVQSSKQPSRTGSRCDLNLSDDSSDSGIDEPGAQIRRNQTYDHFFHEDEVIGPLVPGGKTFFKSFTKEDLAGPKERFNHTVHCMYPVKAKPNSKSFEQGNMALEVFSATFIMAESSFGPHGQATAKDLALSISRLRTRWNDKAKKAHNEAQP